MKIDARNVFAPLTYDDSDAGPPAKSYGFEMYATLESEALLPWENPESVASCLTSLTAKDFDDASGSLTKTDGGITDVEAWAMNATPFVKGLAGCQYALSQNDPALVVYVVARVLTAVYSTARDSVIDPANQALIYKGALEALSRVSTMLKTPHPNGGPQRVNPHTINAPALAMSGGAANGAFSAGFLAELLSLRLQALEQLPAGAARDDADAEARFTALVGTSVGAVISQIVDLYFTDSKEYAPNQAFIDKCNEYWKDRDKRVSLPTPGTNQCFHGWTNDDPKNLNTALLPSSIDATIVKDFPIQACALRYLYMFTEVEEPTLLCVAPGPLTTTMGILGPKHPGLVRFDPMGTHFVNPLVTNIADAMGNNDVMRVDVSIETVQNQTLGLDERSCWQLPKGAISSDASAPLPPGSMGNCLGSGVMASLVLPFFAIPVRHSYSGFTEAGECGSWLDGGLRSGFPALRALHMTRPNAVVGSGTRLRVLALDNGQIDGAPHKRSQTIADVALNAISQMSGQLDVYEIAMAQQEATLRELAIKTIRKVLAGPAAPPPAIQDAGVATKDGGVIAQQLPYALSDNEVSAVWVPNDVPPSIIAGGEYSFDRYIMRGLFTWGRQMAVRRLEGLVSPGKDAGEHRELGPWLGWLKIGNKLTALAGKDDQNVAWSKWRDAFTHEECPDFHVNRTKTGQKRIIDSVADCPVLTDTKKVEPYFSCPCDAGLK